MKKVEITAVSEDANKVEEILRSSELLYSKSTSETNDVNTWTFSLLITDELVDDLIANLSNRMDMRKKENEITVYDVRVGISSYIQRLQEKKGAEKKESPLEAIIQPLDKYLRLTRNMVTMVVLSALIALFGLFLNNVTIIIGAMLISPLLGPINAVNVNACIGRARQVVSAEVVLFSSLLFAVAFVALTTYLASLAIPLPLTDQILQRTSVTPIDVVVSLVLGVAGGIALVSDLPEILVGVAVAAALVPPLSVVGLGIGLGKFSIAEESLLLTLSNLFGLKAGGIVTLLMKGVSPRRFYEKQKARRYSLYLLMIFIIILVVLILLINYSVRQ